MSPKINHPKAFFTLLKPHGLGAILWFYMGFSALEGKPQALFSRSSLPDTLYLSNFSSTYLAFPKEIDLINIGSADYVFQVEKTMVYLKALKAGVKPTNMLVKCGQGLFVVNLVFQTKPKVSLYDFRTINFDLPFSKGHFQGGLIPEKMPKVEFSKKEIIAEKPSSYTRLEPVMVPLSDTLLTPFGIPIQKISSQPDRFKTFGTAQNQITILLTNIYTDTKRMILKFKIINRSSINYDLDYVSFQFRRRSHFSQNTVLSPLYSPLITSCGPKSSQTLVYILPLFGTATNGDFSVTFRELNGDRKETLEVPERAFKMAEQL